MRVLCWTHHTGSRGRQSGCTWKRQVRTDCLCNSMSFSEQCHSCLKVIQYEWYNTNDISIRTLNHIKIIREKKLARVSMETPCIIFSSTLQILRHRRRKTQERPLLTKRQHNNSTRFRAKNLWGRAKLLPTRVFTCFSICRNILSLNTLTLHKSLSNYSNQK